MNIEQHLSERFCRACGQGLRENFEILDLASGTVQCKRCSRKFVVKPFDLGPQKLPASVSQIQAQMNQRNRELRSIEDQRGS
jgi:DNA-directed RNA polymerase subunit RPC12/RpoP